MLDTEELWWAGRVERGVEEVRMCGGRVRGGWKGLGARIKMSKRGEVYEVSTRVGVEYIFKGERLE